MCMEALLAQEDLLKSIERLSPKCREPCPTPSEFRGFFDVVCDLLHNDDSSRIIEFYCLHPPLRFDEDFTFSASHFPEEDIPKENFIIFSYYPLFDLDEEIASTKDCPDCEDSQFCHSSRVSHPQLHLGIRYPNLID
ncbi:hypothetical protein Tco_0499130 [Tanacetum coccineum]